MRRLRLARLAGFAGLVALGACGDVDMPEQHQVTAPGDLLTADGRLREPGWSPRQVQRWNPAQVAEPARLRRWDFFALQSDTTAVNLTLSDLGFLQFATVGVIDLATGAARTGGTLEMNTGRLELSPAVDGDASFTPAGAAAPGMTFTVTTGAAEVTTAIAIDLPGSILGEAVRGAITLHRPLALPYLSLATPFAGAPHQFFFDQKVHGMTAEGAITMGATTWTFAPADTRAVQDWGRGAWPSQVTWRWAGGAAADGTLAFNLGDVGGDDHAGTENLIVHGGVAHKLGRVAWTYDAASPTADWRFASADGRVDLVLHPTAPERSDLDLGERFSHLRKVYGRYAGTVVLDDGQVVQVDGLPGFAEEMSLSW